MEEIEEEYETELALLKGEMRSIHF